MRILKVKGKNAEVIEEQVKKKYGSTAIILNSQQEKETGFLSWLRKPKTVATVAVQDGADKREEGSHEVIKDSNMEQLSYEMLLSLKAQMQVVEESIKDLKKQEDQDNQQKQHSNRSVENIVNKENPIKSLLWERFLGQGIDQEIIEELLSEVEHEDDIEVIVRKFYTEIEALLNKSLEPQDLPQIIFFVGPTGVGKTTTIAKLTADYVLNKNKEIVLFTSDTYRIAAIDQLTTYADILGVNIEIIYEEKELGQYLDKWQAADHIFIDTAGRSHKNIEQLKDIKVLLDSVEQKEILLVVNASTPYKDVKKVIDTYEELCQEFKLIITKLDETDQTGNIINIAYYAQKPILYLTHGQNVPTDISAFNVDDFTRDLLGRINHE